MTKFIIAQVLLLIGSLLMVVSGLPKNRKTILTLQNSQLVFMTAGLVLLGSITGAATNIIGIVRNTLSNKGRMSRNIQLILILATIVITVPLNTLGWVGMLPIISACAFTIAVRCNSIITYKSIFIFTCVLWLVHDIYVKAWATVPFDMFGIITNLISIFQTIKQVKSA